MASICTDLHALNCKNCSQMVNWILVELENDFFWYLVFGYLVFQKKIFFLLFPNKNNLGFHMRNHLFLHYGWFLQNLEGDFTGTNMHTTVTCHLHMIKWDWSNHLKTFYEPMVLYFQLALKAFNPHAYLQLSLWIIQKFCFQSGSFVKKVYIFYPMVKTNTHLSFEWLLENCGKCKNH